MKSIINGKRYDTKTAEVIAEWDNGYYGSDFKSCEETLYKTAKGNWFLVGEGGPMSKYAQAVQGGTGGGKALTPLTPQEAMAWLEEKNCLEALEEHFPDAIEAA